LTHVGKISIIGFTTLQSHITDIRRSGKNNWKKFEDFLVEITEFA